LEDVGISKDLHGKNRGAMLLGNRRNTIKKRAEMRIHHIDRHLHSVEMEGVLVRSLKHAQVHAGIPVTCEADVADRSCLFGFLNGTASMAPPGAR
jgi:hypothetical protein